MTKNCNYGSFMAIFATKKVLKCNRTFDAWKSAPTTLLGWRTSKPWTFQPQASTPNLSTLDFLTMNFSTQWFTKSWLQSPELKSSRLKSLGLKGLELKLGAEKSKVETSFNLLLEIHLQELFLPTTTKWIGIGQYLNLTWRLLEIKNSLEQNSGGILTSTEPNIFRMLFSIKNQKIMML